MKLIGLTTCPKHSSGNVGDMLITKSGIKLFKNINQNIDFDIYFREEDLTSRIEKINKAKAIILLGFPIIDSYLKPKYYRLTYDLKNIKIPIIPLGAAYNFFPGEKSLIQFKSLQKSTKNFINNLVKYCPNGQITARTEWVRLFLEKEGYNSILSGDLAWFDSDYIGEEFHKPKVINQIVFTPPHMNLYLEQASNLLKKIGSEFPSAKKIISYQSSLTDLDKKIRTIGTELGWEIRYTSHDIDNLNFYKKTDLHIGYRKHGHLAHLRWRRPSIVIAEDSRSMGLIDTFGGSGFPGFNTDLPSKEKLTKTYFANHKINVNTNPNLIEDIFEFITIQRITNWKFYKQVKEVIDKTYKNTTVPYIKEIIKSLN